MLNARCIEILNALIKNDGEIYAWELANKFSVSERMIRYDIDSINSYLNENNLCEVEKKSNSPLKIELSDDDKNKLFKLIDNLDNDVYILSNEERIGIILYELLSANKVYTYSKLQEILAVSKSTIVSDLKKSKQWLLKYNLNIEKHSQRGIVINGEEKNIRKAITDLLIGNTGYNIVKTLEKIYNTENSNFISNIKRMELSDCNLKYIKELIREIEDEFGVFTDSDFMNLVFTVFVMVNRSKVKLEKGNNNNFEIKDQYKKEYDSAKKIVEKLQQNLDVVYK